MLIAANILLFMGGLMMVAVGLLKSKEHMLMAQCGQFGLQAVGHFLAGAVSGGISTAISIIRIFVFKYVKVTVWLKLGFIALQAVLTWAFGADSLVDWIPLFAMIPYTWFLDTKNAVLFKVVNLIGTSMWLIHDISFKEYGVVVFDVLAVVSMSCGIVMLLRDKKKKADA